jgi:hypothetical protein
MAGTSSAKMRFALLPGHDEEFLFSTALMKRAVFQAMPVSDWQPRFP